MLRNSNPDGLAAEDDNDVRVIVASNANEVVLILSFMVQIALILYCKDTVKTRQDNDTDVETDSTDVEKRAIFQHIRSGGIRIPPENTGSCNLTS